MLGFRAFSTGPPCHRAPALSELPDPHGPRLTRPGPAGYELRTFECPKCDRFQRTLVVSDPMSGDARGWLAGELGSPG